MENLRECPFCKASCIRVNIKRAKTGFYGDGMPVHYVTASARCGRCHARGPVVSAERIPSKHGADENAELEELKQEAIAAWNRRAEISQLQSSLARAEAERDAAVKCITRNCSSYEAVEGGIPYCAEKCAACDGCVSLWRGLKGE
jgi:hypothetical protein